MRNKRSSHPGDGHRRPGRHRLVSMIFMWIGILTVLYLLITQVLMRILALLTR